MICGQKFSAFNRKHHCRQCGRVVCSTCSPHRVIIDPQTEGKPERACSGCVKDVAAVKSKGQLLLTVYVLAPVSTKMCFEMFFLSICNESPPALSLYCGVCVCVCACVCVCVCVCFRQP